jgi:hypothetical protein
MKTTLFVAFSHTLTQSQIDGFQSQFSTQTVIREFSDNGGIPTGDGGEAFTEFVDFSIVSLGEVAPELQAQMSQIPARATLQEVQELAKSIVAEAIKAGATHFFCVGEPTLTMWANLLIERKMVSARLTYYVSEDGTEVGWGKTSSVFVEDRYKVEHPQITCIQSTTERQSVEETQPDGSVLKKAIFNHVMWREMF